jgi:predicted TPR repeat methyltransferase
MSFWGRARRRIARALGHDPRLDMLRRCAAGAIPVPIALMNLVEMTGDRVEAAGLVEKALAAKDAGRARLHELGALLRDHSNAHEIVRRINGAFTPRAPGLSEVEHWAAMYDAAVKISPEACVALYSFGDPALLGKITEELIAKLLDWGVVGATSRVLDYGCGIGRVSAGLAPHVGEIVGVDVSTGMLREARARLADLAHVSLMPVADLSSTETLFDLILIVDVCPYFAEPGEVLGSLLPRLAAGGSLIVMNWSYSIGPVAEREAAREFARAHGLTLVREGTAEFTLWDGLVFHFRKAA